jgi:hypothetical protein
MADAHDLQVLIILVLIPLAIAGTGSALDGIDAASSFIRRACRSFTTRSR